jgi:membrane-associated protein
VVQSLIDYVLNLDAHLARLIAEWGAWVYAAIFATIFAETGLVVAPFLPGESLLLASGTLAGAGVLEILVLAPLLFVAAFLGDTCNYLIGRFIGQRLLSKPRQHLRPEHVQEAREFYERHGGMAIVFARFLPIVRTLAPFVAGVATMEIHRFIFFAAIASALWVTIFVGAGYWFGTTRWVQDYFAFALLAIVATSAIPGFVIYVVHRVRSERVAKR